MKVVEFHRWEENTVGKGEGARYEQFLLFLKCFQKTCTANKKEPGLVWERVNQQSANQIPSCHIKIKTLALHGTISSFKDPMEASFWKHRRKKEKMLVTSIFSFSHIVFDPLMGNFNLVSHIWIVICRFVVFGPSTNLNPLPHNAAFWHTKDI